MRRHSDTLMEDQMRTRIIAAAAALIVALAAALRTPAFSGRAAS